MYGLPFCQYDGLAVYWMLFGLHGLTSKGPVPTGFWSAQVSGCFAAAPVLQMCLGTMPIWSAKVKKYGCGALSNDIVTVLPDAVTLFSPAPFQREYTSVPGNSLSVSKVKTTSSGVNGWPSLHVTPERIVKTIDFLSALHL